MSLSQVKNAIERFIQNSRNDLLVIKGGWGVGKTYFWNKTVKEASAKGGIGHKNYSYVSLFGIDSFETLKNSIVANQVNSLAVGKTFDESASVIFSGLKNLGKYAEKSDFVRKYSGGLLSEFAFHFIKDSLICIDDLERRSNKFDIRDIFGLASFLKEQRNCKVVFILNEGTLSEEDRKEFARYNEKIVDLELSFAPATEEVFSYIFDSSFPYSDLIKQSCQSLKLKNIRILQKIRYSVETIMPDLEGIQPNLIEGIIRALALFIWSHYSKDNPDAIPIEFIRGYDLVGAFIDEKYQGKQLTDEEKKFRERLSIYGYSRVAVLDDEIIFYVENGYLSEKFSEILDTRNASIIAQNGVNEYGKAWQLYNKSFKATEEEFTTHLFKGFRSNIDFLELRNLNETVRALKEFDANEKAEILINEFIEKRYDAESKTLRLRGHNDFTGLDSDIVQKLDEKSLEIRDERTLEEVLEKLNESSIKYLEDVNHLMTFEENDFYAYFSSYEPKPQIYGSEYVLDLYNQIRSCLDFLEYTDERRIIGTNVKNAVIRIALESRIKKSRILNWFKQTTEEEIEQAREAAQ